MPVPPGAAGLPFTMFHGYLGTDLPKVNPAIKFVTCPYTASSSRPSRRTGRMWR